MWLFLAELVGMFLSMLTVHNIDLHNRFQSTIISQKMAYHQYVNILNSYFETQKSQMNSFKSLSELPKFTQQTRPKRLIHFLPCLPIPSAYLRSQWKHNRTRKQYLNLIQRLQGVLNYECTLFAVIIV